MCPKRASASLPMVSARTSLAISYDTSFYALENSLRILMLTGKSSGELLNVIFTLYSVILMDGRVHNKVACGGPQSQED